MLTVSIVQIVLSLTVSIDSALALNVRRPSWGALSTHDDLAKRDAMPFYPIGCFNDNQNYRSLADDALYAEDMTIEKCQSYCSSQSPTYTIFGLEYGRECYCGSGLRNGASQNQDSCATSCAGDKIEVCGGGLALSVYTINFQLAVSVFSTPSVTQLGCFEDFYGSPTNYRILNGANYASDDMTMESCSQFCHDRGYAFGGVEYSRECFCGSDAPKVTSSGCTMHCAGNSIEICGGENAINVFQNKYSTGASSVSTSSVSASSSTSSISTSSSSASSSATSISSSATALTSSSSSLSSSSSTSAPPPLQTQYTIGALFRQQTSATLEITIDRTMPCMYNTDTTTVYGFSITSVTGIINYQANGFESAQVALASGNIPPNQYTGTPDQCLYPDLPRYPFSKNGIALTADQGTAQTIYFYAQASQNNDDIYGTIPTSSYPYYEQVFFDYSTDGILFA